MNKYTHKPDIKFLSTTIIKSDSQALVELEKIKNLWILMFFDIFSYTFGGKSPISKFVSPLRNNSITKQRKRYIAK